MFNLVLLAARPPDWTHDRFIQWWRGEHAEMTYTLPGLRAWRHTEVESALEPRSEGWDGISILSFDTEEDLRAALASEQWAAAVRHVGEMRGRRIALLGNERLMFPAGQYPGGTG